MRIEFDSKSYWSPYYSAFPLIGDHVLDVESRQPAPAACVIGASDGKFVTPLLQRGWSVVAIELDQTFLDGGTIELRDGLRSVSGLRQRVAELGAEGRCEIVREDYMSWLPRERFSLVTTSGLWCMPDNRKYDLVSLVKRQQEYVRQHGIFFADYLMATNSEERATGFCPEPDELAAIFDPAEWMIHLNHEMGRFGESHLGWEDWHEHRYAAIIAVRRGPLDES